MWHLLHHPEQCPPLKPLLCQFRGKDVLIFDQFSSQSPHKISKEWCSLAFSILNCLSLSSEEAEKTTSSHKQTFVSLTPQLLSVHNVFHSLLTSFTLRKWWLLIWRRTIIMWHPCSPSRLLSPVPLGYNWDQFSTQTLVKTTRWPTQWSQPSIWVEKTTQHFLEYRMCMRMDQQINNIYSWDI